MAAAEQEVVAPTPERMIAEAKPRPSGFWERWVGKQMVFQTKGKAIITGTFKEFRNSFLFIENATVTGLKRRVNPSLVVLDRNFISHFHEQCPVEDVEQVDVTTSE